MNTLHILVLCWDLLELRVDATGPELSPIQDCLVLLSQGAFHLKMYIQTLGHWRIM